MKRITWKFQESNNIWKLYIDDVFSGFFDNHEKEKLENVFSKLF